MPSNALQITDPNEDSDNPLAQAPSWADAYGSVSGAVSGGVAGPGREATQVVRDPQGNQ